MTSRFRTILPAGLLIMLGVSLAANAILFQQGQQYYADLNAARLDPLGLALLEPVANTGQPRVVFFGDSRAADWYAPPLPDFQFVNRGIDAQTSAQVLGRVDEHVRPLDADFVIVQAGINDLKTIPLFPERQAAIVADCKRNLAQIVNGIRADGSTVILTTIFPVGPVPLVRRLAWSDAIPEAILEVNDYIRSLEGDGVIVFDTYALLSEAGASKPAYVHDTLHFNAAAYAALNEALVVLLMGPE